MAATHVIGFATAPSLAAASAGDVNAQWPIGAPGTQGAKEDFER